MKRRPLPLAALLAFVLVASVVPTRAIRAASPGFGPHRVNVASDTEQGPPPTDRTPPRLSYADGQVSFWREGAEDWTQARVNTPLAPGDQLSVGNSSNVELQIGGRDFLRVASNSQLAFDNDESDYRQFRLTAGQASVDLHGMRAGQIVEVDTPNGAFTIDHNGYYRVEVDEDSTHFATRRGGRATVTPGNRDPEDISPSEEVVVKGDDVESYAASEPDAWDRWNYDRSDQLVEAVSYRHVPDDVYGVDDLDHNGRWRVVPQYGSVWFPSQVATGWAPYTSGHWILDPYFGWTWVDDASWGWAPFHYGRWVSVGGYWAWAPGPIVARPIYAPALVAFFSDGPLSIGVSLGGAPLLGWTALGWGEPCRPWWGPSNFIGRPRWFGWGGPRVTIDQRAVNNINVYQNARVHDGVVVVNRNDFGRGPVGRGRVAASNLSQMSPIRGALPVNSDPVRVVGGAARGQRPPQAALDRPVVATRAPADSRSRGFFGGSRREAGAPPNPPAQIVPSPRDARSRGTLQRPRFGEQTGVERAAPPPPPRFGDVGNRRQGASSTAARSAPDANAIGNARRGRMQQQAERSAAPQPPAPVQPSHHGVDRRAAPRAATPRSAPPVATAPMESSRRGRQQAGRQLEAASPRVARDLPGQPANRVWAGRSSAGPAAPPIASPRNVAVPRHAVPQTSASSGGRNPRRVAAEQPSPSPAPNTAPPDAGSRGRGHRAQ